jgi:hypothetical protein
MKTQAPFFGALRGPQRPLSMVMALGLASSAGTLLAEPPFIFGGLAVMNPETTMNISEFGYSDSLLDGRSMFLGREFLSGEWAAAIYYEGGNLPSMTRWLTDRFVFPDYYTPMPHFTSMYDPDFKGYGPNTDGFPAYGSAIMNADLEVKMRYETLDLGDPISGRLALGTTPQSEGGTGDYLPSQRYVYKQTYDFKNTTDMPLNNVVFYQFLHTLHGDRAVYDGRDHGGGMPSYRYGITIQGESYSFNMHTYETVRHTDTVTMKYSLMPSGYEVGPYGMKNAGDHQTGEPAVGVHKSVDANSLSGTDEYDPDETDESLDAWVAGASSINIGTLAPDETTSLDILLAVNTTHVVVEPAIKLVIHKAGLVGTDFIIDFEEKTHNPRVGFILRSTDMLDGTPKTEWPQVAVSYLSNVPMLNSFWRRYQVGVDTAVKRNLLFLVQPTIINDP